MYTFKIQQGMENFEDAYKIRTDVFVKEQGFNDEFDEIDKKSYHIVIYDGTLPIATGRTFTTEDGVYKLGRIAVAKDYRGKQIGKMIIENLENKVRELGGKCIKLSAQIQAKGFYDKLGYDSYGEEYMDEHCLHIGMEKML